MYIYIPPRTLPVPALPVYLPNLFFVQYINMYIYVYIPVKNNRESTTSQKVHPPKLVYP